jgi:hypothetical protein
VRQHLRRQNIAELRKRKGDVAETGGLRPRRFTPVRRDVERAADDLFAGRGDAFLGPSAIE